MSISSALSAFAVLVAPVGAGWAGSRRNGKAEKSRKETVREYQRLLSAGDHLLADIGITRADVEAAMREAGAR